MKAIFNSMLACILLTSCTGSDPNAKGTNSATVSASLPEMQVDNSAQSFGGDISLHINSLEKIDQEITSYKILSAYRGKPIGFQFILKRPAENREFVEHGVTFKSLGDTSNNFLNALAEIYQIKKNNLVFVDSITVTYADLTYNFDSKTPGNWVAAQKKLFFETKDDESELYLNIDNDRKIISFPEKDSSYRLSILEALSKYSK